MIRFPLAALLCLAGAPGLAQDAAAGAELFAGQCAVCHVVRNADGVLLAGRAGRVGPNLFGVLDGPAAGVPGFAYSSALREAAAMGLVWDGDNFAAFIGDPNGFLRGFTGQEGARSKMAWRVETPRQAADLHAFLESLE